MIPLLASMSALITLAVFPPNSISTGSFFARLISPSNVFTAPSFTSVDDILERTTCLWDKRLIRIPIFLLFTYLLS